MLRALRAGKTAQESIDFAVAASAIKHTIEGDVNRATVSEVESLAVGAGSAQVSR